MKIENPHGNPKNMKILDKFMKDLSLKWSFNAYISKNIYHYTGMYKEIDFEVFIHYYSEDDTYKFTYQNQSMKSALEAVFLSLNIIFFAVPLLINNK